MRSELDQTLQVLDGSVNENALGIVAGGMCRKNGIGASGKNKDIVGYYVVCRGLDCFVLGEDVGDSGAEVVVER